MSTNGKRRKGDYEVGKGKPPKHTQFKKGEPSPNPKGRTPGRGITDLVRALAHTELKDSPRLKKLAASTGFKGDEDATLADALAEIAIKKMLEGDFRFWQYMVDRLEGPVTQQIQARIWETFELSEEDQRIADRIATSRLARN